MIVPMAVKYFAPEPGQSLGHRGFFDIGACDGISKVQEELGNTAHADTAYSHKMDVSGLAENFHKVIYLTLPLP